MGGSIWADVQRGWAGCSAVLRHVSVGTGRAASLAKCKCLDQQLQSWQKQQQHSKPKFQTTIWGRCVTPRMAISKPGRAKGCQWINSLCPKTFTENISPSSVSDEKLHFFRLSLPAFQWTSGGFFSFSGITVIVWTFYSSTCASSYNIQIYPLQVWDISLLWSFGAVIYY